MATFTYPRILEIDTSIDPATGTIPGGIYSNIAVLNNSALVDAYVGTTADIAAGKGRVPAGTSKTFPYTGRAYGPIDWDDRAGGDLIITCTA